MSKQAFPVFKNGLMRASAPTQGIKVNMQSTMPTSYRNTHNVESCHSERSEGSLHWYNAGIIFFIIFAVQRFFGQRPQNDMVVNCGTSGRPSPTRGGLMRASVTMLINIIKTVH